MVHEKIAGIIEEVEFQSNIDELPIPMKFSLRFLLTIVLLGGVVANGWRMHANTVPLISEIDSLKQESELRQNFPAFQQFEARKIVYQRFQNAFKTHQTEFATAKPQFDQLVSRYATLDIGDRSQFAIIRAPTIADQNTSRNQWNIFIPKGMSLQLAIDFLDNTHQKKEKSKFFSPPTPWEIPLPEGQSEILLAWSSVTGQPNLTLSINGTRQYEFQSEGSFSGVSTTGPAIANQAGDEFVRPNRELLVLTPTGYSNLARDPFDESILVSITDPSQKGESQ